MKFSILLLSVAFIFGHHISYVNANVIEVVGWNMESGGADPTVLSEQIENFSGVDLWGFSEIKNMEWANTFAEASAEGEQGQFGIVLGSTGGEDKLLIIYNKVKFEEIRHFELHDINPQGRVRSPLVAHFRIIGTNTEFLFMVNHLYRSREDARHQQSIDLNAWAQQQTFPIIAVGDYNYDWDVEDGETDHDKGFDHMTNNGVFMWVRPPRLVRTHCSNRFNSVLDFVFVSQAALDWMPQSTIGMSEPEYCPDDETTSDHRPILANFTLSPPTTPGGGVRVELLRQIDEIKQLLKSMRTRVEQIQD